MVHEVVAAEAHQYGQRLKVVEAFRKSGNLPQWMISTWSGDST